MKYTRLTAIYASIILASLKLCAQSLPVGTPVLEDYYRRSQLLGITDTNFSYTVRPLFPVLDNKTASIFYPDNTGKPVITYKLSDFLEFGKKVNVSLLPINFETQVNTDHPYGWNDGSLIPAKGLQTRLSAGIFAKYGPLTIQLRPEFVYAANNNFSTFNTNQYDVIFARYYDIYNNIDLPVRFGTGSYQKAYWGQSSIRLNFKSLSFGLSTENLWWGPGVYNSLLLSNTAPGFAHLTLNTSRPLKTAIGSFEGQLIAGRLSNSGYAPLQPDHFYFGTNLYVPKLDDWRYLGGVILTWQPKWVPGLFLGFNQTSQTYGKSLSGLKSYLPIFSSVKSSGATDQAISKQDQLNSIFMRWLWLKEHAEIYFDYGHYNNSKDFTQLQLNPNDSRAYIFGIRKLLPFNRAKNENLLIGIEVTQLQENSITNIENGTQWYVSKAIRQGYTNAGQELGAGIGPGGNLQTIEVSWVKGLKKLGLQIERYAHNNDFYYYAFQDSKNYTQHWTDLSLAFKGEWNYKNLIFNAKLQGIQSLNYQWALTKNGNDIFFENQINKFNLSIQTGASYRF